MRKELHFALPWTLVLLNLVLSSSAYAQEAFTIPRSDRVISGELVLPPSGRDKEWKARFVVRDGTWVTVEDRKAGYFFAFNGVMNDQTGHPNFVPYKLFRITPEDTEVVEIGQSGFASPDTPDPTRDIPIGRTVTFTRAGGIKLRVTGTGTSVFAAPYITDISKYDPKDLEAEFGFWSSGTCCVTCQGRTVCASSVDTSCGDCDGGGGGGSGPRVM